MKIIARGTVSEVSVGKPDFRVGNFYWFYELEMGRSPAVAITKQGVHQSQE
jgi:hypothetical protein